MNDAAKTQPGNDNGEPGGDSVWYFAYGSNLDPERFRSRVCDFADRRRAVLHDHVLRFSGEVTSEGGGGAIIEPSAGDKVYGGAYRIERTQIEKLDEIELGSERNPAQRGVRRTITLACPDGEIDAEVYVVPKPEVYRAPSEDYLDHILRGLRAFGHGETVVEEVRAVAAREPAG